jgi:hypothetical protein
MASLTTIMAELAEAIRAATAGTDPKIEVYNVMEPTPTTMAVDVYPADPFRDKLSGGFGDISGAYIFTVRARVDEADLDASQAALLALMDDEDPRCLASAVMTDQTLNGNASSVDVDGPSGYIRYADVDRHAPLLGVEWKVRVLPARS